MNLTEEYTEYEFDDDAVEVMSEVFESNTMDAVELASSPTEMTVAGKQLVDLCMSVCMTFGVEGEDRRKALVMQGFERFSEREVEQALESFAGMIEEL